MKSKLKQLIKDFSTLDSNDYVREEELENKQNEIIEEMLSKNIIDDDWCSDHSRHQVPHLLYALLDKLS